MVIEALITPRKAENRPWAIFFFGVFFASISIILSLIVFRTYASLIMVFFIVMGSLPLVYNVIKFEEKKDEECLPEKTLLKEHWKALEVFLFLFLGFTVAIALWYVFLPGELVKDVFSAQIGTIQQINHAVTGKVAGIDTFFAILFNNLRVLMFCIIFSFLYGFGALFILTWNASVIGAAIGQIIRNSLSEIAGVVGLEKYVHYFQAFSFGLLRYAPHGILEIAAYFIAGLAGSLISVGIIRHNFATKKFETILFDAMDLVIISLVITFVAAIVEVYITPAIF